MQYPELRNPPIEEMIISLEFQPLVNNEGIEAFLEDNTIKDAFNIPERKDSKFRLEDIRNAFFAKEDSNRGLKLNLDSFSYHRLKHVSFETFYEEYLSYWSVFQKHTGVEAVDSMILRYVNLIKIEQDEIDMSQYSKVFIHNNLEVENNNFFFQISVSKKGNESIKGNVTETLGSANGKDGMFIDISVQTDSKYPSDLRIAKEALFEMRDFKNYLFFNTVSEMALEPYK